MTLAHPSRTHLTPVSGPHRGDGRTDAHVRHHEFLLVTRYLPGRHTPAADVLRPVVAARRGGWLGQTPTQALPRATYHDEVCAHPVPLTGPELDGRVVGQCERSLSAVYLDPAPAPPLDASRADAYRRVNDRFAAAAADLAAIGGVVLIVGHQLQLVPAMLRQRRPDLLIAFFLDVPFPSGEVFRRMPMRHDVLTGVLGADLVGLQTQRSADNLRRLALEDADVGLGRGGLVVDGRPVGVGVYPQSVDAAALRTLATQPGSQERTRAVRAGLGDPQRVVLAVDDLHTAAGVEQRLAAYEQLLDNGEVDPGHTVLVQVVRPDPTAGASARDLRARIERHVGRINDRHGRAVHYQHRAPDQAELVALYCAADVLMATPMHAGTSLVAKEFLATRSDNSGAVVLSELSGTAEELTDADTVDPHDGDDLRRVMLRAVDDTSSTRRSRMAAMRRHVHTHDVHHWAGSLLSALGQNAATVPDPSPVRR